MTNVLVALAPAAIIASHRHIEQGHAPSLVGHHHRPGGTLPYAGTCLSFLLCRDAGLYSLDWSRAPFPAHAVAIELQGQHLAWEREIDSKEGAITAWEVGLVTLERAHGKVLTERDASRI
jgi:hypothetical protein